jgi:carboxynorspermidine decarboxylase
LDYSKIPSPAFVLDEKLLRKNLELIDRVQKEAGIEIIWLLKDLPCGVHFRWLGNI